MIAVSTLGDPPRRRGLGRAATLGVGLSIALHAGALAYLAIARFAPTLLDRPETPGVQVQMIPPPLPPEPPKPEPLPETPSLPPRPAAAPRDAVIPELTFDVMPAPFAPAPDIVVADGPPVMVFEPAPPAPAPVVEAPPAPPTPTVITRPTWLKRPSADQLADAYPARALRLERTGSAVLSCSVTARGSLTGCVVASETPEGAGFGAAALKLTRHFLMSPRTEDGRPVDGGQVRIPVAFTLAG